MNQRKRELEPLLSSDRLGPYLIASSGNFDKAIGLYERNQALSEALYVPLQNLEVGLRNRLHALFCRHFGNLWFHAGLLRKPHQVQAILATCRKFELAGKPPSSGGIVAEMTFGFWTSFFDGTYSRNGQANGTGF